ncbi:MAG: DEAD/DEAH box helicase [Oceanospirillaceae bacterium]|nr:DEAD/DEAH box helicase [Oceanospirillaceae bacterium]
MRTFEDATLDAVDLLQQQDIRLPYRSVIVDEAQDMGPQALTLIRRLVQPQQADDLFIVGDGHQRIYRRKTTMSQCGIQIVGRSRKLRFNYRTTEETRRFASAILEGVSVDDLDGGEDRGDDYRSLLHGSEPQVAGFPTQAAECLGIAEQIQALLEEGIVSQDICVATRTRKYRDKINDHLVSAGLPTLVLSQQIDNRNVAGVRLATMHRVKGLEFRYMILAVISEGTVPLPLALGSTDDPVERRQNELNERALLHVAATRALASPMPVSLARICRWQPNSLWKSVDAGPN